MEPEETTITRERSPADAPLQKATEAAPVARGSTALAQRVFAFVAPRPGRPPEVTTPKIVAVPVRRPSAYLLTFIAFVIIPSILAAAYLIFVASDQYVAEARFAVRTEQVSFGEKDKSDSSTSSSSAGVSIPALASPDAYIITSYIRSRAMVDALSKTIDLKAIFQRPEADFWARLKNNASPEAVLDYWNGMISTYIDGPSGIVIVKVRAFRRDDALLLVKAVLDQSEKLANEVSARARNDTMQRAEDEVRRSQGLVEDALGQEQQYREAQGFIDPVSAAKSTSTLLLQSMADKIEIENELFVASSSLSADAPTLTPLKARLQAVDNQIVSLKAQLTSNSPEAQTISTSLLRFEELELKRTFAEKLYTIAQEALERARARAESQSIYISVFVPPALPEEATFPQRVSLSILIPLGLLIVWGIFALLGAAVEDHRY